MGFFCRLSELLCVQVLGHCLLQRSESEESLLRRLCLCSPGPFKPCLQPRPGAACQHCSPDPPLVSSLITPTPNPNCLQVALTGSTSAPTSHHSPSLGCSSLLCDPLPRLEAGEPPTLLAFLLKAGKWTGWASSVHRASLTLPEASLLPPLRHHHAGQGRKSAQQNMEAATCTCYSAGSPGCLGPGI